MIVGNFLPKSRQNYTIGIRLPWTLSDKENWNSKHRFAGKVWIAGGLILAINAFLNCWIIALVARFEGELFERLLQHKIYDFLPWETEMPVMLEKWRHFCENADENTVYVFNCVMLQNPMCETMMRFGFTLEQSQAYISEIAKIIQPLDPVVIYLKNDDIQSSVEKAAREREGWLEAVIDYHVNGAYGNSIGAEGFDGYISCLEERQRRMR